MTDRITVEQAEHAPLPKKIPELRINPAVALAFLLQTATAFMWAGAAENRIHQLEKRVQTREQFFERTARLEENVDAIRIAVERLELKVDELQSDVMRGGN